MKKYVIVATHVPSLNNLLEWMLKEKGFEVLLGDCERDVINGFSLIDKKKGTSLEGLILGQDLEKESTISLLNTLFYNFKSMYDYAVKLRYISAMYPEQTPKQHGVIDVRLVPPGMYDCINEIRNRGENDE